MQVSFPASKPLLHLNIGQFAQGFLQLWKLEVVAAEVRPEEVKPGHAGGEGGQLVRVQVQGGQCRAAGKGGGQLPNPVVRGQEVREGGQGGEVRGQEQQLIFGKVAVAESLQKVEGGGQPGEAVVCQLKH